MEQAEARRETRRLMRLPFRYLAGGELARTVSLDVSSRGLFLLAEHPLALGQRFTLAPLSEQTPCHVVLEAWVRWRWATPTLDRQLTGMGVQLITARCPPAQQAQLDDWLNLLSPESERTFVKNEFEGRGCIEFDFSSSSTGHGPPTTQP